MEKISVIMPVYAISQELVNLTWQAIDSLEPIDELILIDNGGYSIHHIAMKADIYIKNKRNLGFGKSVNQGLKLATGDYLAVVNNDIKLLSGNLKSLAIANTVTSPKVDNQEPLPEHFGIVGCFFVLPRIVYEKVGGFDERFEIGYWEDTDLFRRIKEAGFDFKTVEEVRIWHKGGATIHQMERDKYFYENKKKFEEKWKEVR